MSRLHELAQRLGVEITHSDKIVMAQNTKNAVAMNVHCRRPDKDIAHDMLVGLPPKDFDLERYKGEWRAVHYSMPLFSSGLVYRGPSFEEAVCALAERHLENKP